MYWDTHGCGIVSVSCNLLCGRLSDVIRLMSEQQLLVSSVPHRSSFCGELGPKTEDSAYEPYEFKCRARSSTKTTDRQVAGILLCDLCAYFNRMQVM